MELQFVYLGSKFFLLLLLSIAVVIKNSQNNFSYLMQGYIGPSFVHASNSVSWAQGPAASTTQLPGCAGSPLASQNTSKRTWVCLNRCPWTGIAALAAFTSYKKSLKESPQRCQAKQLGISAEPCFYLYTFFLFIFMGCTDFCFYAKKLLLITG